MEEITLGPPSSGTEINHEREMTAYHELRITYWQCRDLGNI